MKGIDNLIAMRRAKKRPDSVTINFDLPYRRPIDVREWRCMELSFAPCHDLRPFADLDVLLIAHAWRHEIGDLYEALTQYARSIAVLIAAFGDDIGWWWDREFGRCDFGQRCYAREIREVHADATHAALKSDAQAYRAAQIRESEIIAARNASLGAA